MCTAANSHNRYGYGVYGVQRRFPSGSLTVDAVFVNAGPVPLHAMFSTCQSANMALIFVRLLCVPPVAVPPGVLAFANTFTFELAAKFVWLVVSPMPWKFTVVPDA